jgi:transposase
MGKIDARKDSPRTQYEIGKQVVRLRKQGFLNIDVAEGFGVSVGRASIIWQSYKKEGSKAIKLGRRGRRSGEKRTLTTEQESQVKRALLDKTPDQLKFPFALWTRDAMNSEFLIKFTICLTKDAGRKVFLILHNLRVHHNKNAKKWLEKYKEQIEVFHLSSYSPELNPDEYLNGNLKNKMHSGIPIRNREDLEKKARSFIRNLVKRPTHVRSYFSHPKVAYAA